MSRVSHVTLGKPTDGPRCPHIEARDLSRYGVPPTALQVRSNERASEPESTSLPSKAEIRTAIPGHCFDRSLPRSLRFAAESLTLTSAIVVAAWLFLPLTWVWLPVWALYAVACGTAATGLWVIAHECGHRAFCTGTRLQDTIGFVIHSALLVPYFSWQRSHAIHHARTNHLSEGETHVPPRSDTPRGQRSLEFHERVGARVHGMLTLVGRLLFGWPLYLLFGLTGGPERGVTTHFAPSSGLFPRRWRVRVWLSTAGVVSVLGLLAWWAVAAGSIAPVVALYVGPYLVVNAWLVALTWLHHTDVEVPHYDVDDWTFVSGVFNTVDRSYGRMIDRLHHRIGSTHALHHFDARVPHYHAAEATAALAEAFPEHYRYDDTPVRQALWRISKDCVVVDPTDDGWRFRE